MQPLNPHRNHARSDEPSRSGEDRFDFRFRCFDCVYWRAKTQDCVLGYPVEELTDTTQPIQRPDGQWVTCKHFDLD